MIKLVKPDSVECIGEFEDEYVYDIEMEDSTNHTFFANDILVHNSCYLSISNYLNVHGIKLLNGEGKVNKYVYDICDEIEKELNKEIKRFGETELNSKDCRFEFKRESICDSALFIKKKRYLLRVLDDEGIQTDKIKITGYSIKSAAVPNSIKKYLMRIVETILKTKSYDDTFKIYKECYSDFKKLTVEELAFPRSIKDYNKYASRCEGFKTVKAMPVHVKSAYYYNKLLDSKNISDKYQKIKSGDKIRFFYVKKNCYGIETIAFKDKFPTQFDDIRVDYEKMFQTLINNNIEILFTPLNWELDYQALNCSINLTRLFS